jgi:elongation factor G
VFGGALAEGAELVGADGERARAGALFATQGATTTRIQRAEPGEIVGIAKADAAHAGQLMGIGGSVPATARPYVLPAANAALAIAVSDHKDEVRLSTALNRLIEEDPGLSWGQDEHSRETLLRGFNDEHLAVALDRLKRRYAVAVTVRQPAIAYRETIRKTASQHGRHKKQSGGHGQFGDVVIDIRPLPRSEGFLFEDRITGGAIPRQWIPAVEQGVRDAMLKGPLGAPVVDVAVTLVDGSFHAVDSSELAFRTAGRIAMVEALAAGTPYLLEPVMRVVIQAPGSATSRVNSAVASKRGQMLGITPLPGWSRWDEIEAMLPEAELHGLDAELRALSQGMARHEAHFDHLAEVTPKLTADVVQRINQPA